MLPALASAINVAGKENDRSLESQMKDRAPYCHEKQIGDRIAASRRRGTSAQADRCSIQSERLPDAK